MTKKEEREIRKCRRALIRADRERRRAERRAKKEKYERLASGPPLACAPQEPSLAAVRSYLALRFCVVCETIRREDFMFNEDTCLACRILEKEKEDERL